MDPSSIPRIFILLILVSSVPSIYCDHYEVILQGASGDLAKRFLWKSVYSLHASGLPVKVFAASKSGLLDIPKLLKESIAGISEEARNIFAANISPVQLSKHEDYNELCDSVLNRSAVQHIFYLSVPPFAYTEIANFIKENCHSTFTSSNVTGLKKSSLRIVLEKPFGHDLTSAQEMSEKFSSWLNDEQIYRVDHYLGKAIVRSILPFRAENPHLEQRWNLNYVNFIEVRLWEKLDVEDRLEYYDQYGVIRDMLQNHATEVLLQLLQDLSDNDALRGDQLLKSDALYLADLPLLGQYRHYKGKARTPTFAAINLRASTDRWRGVPIYVSSGKYLGKKMAFARVSFLPNFETGDKEEIYFLIERDVTASNQPKVGIICSRSLHCSPPTGFVSSSDRDISNGIVEDEFPSSHYEIFLPTEHEEPYVNVLRDILYEKRSSFINLQHLMESWKLWSHVIEWGEVVPIRSYSTPGEVAFIATPSNFRWKEERAGDREILTMAESVISIQGRQTRVIRGSNAALGLVLANEIRTDIASLNISDSAYHLGLPGGQSPLRLMQSFLFSHSFPSTKIPFYFAWSRLHLWQVDERCCHPKMYKQGDCNQHGLWTTLFHRINSPYPHRHLVPLEGACAARCSAYQEHWHVHHPPLSQMDHVVLGIGSDGHVASLFPTKTNEFSEKEPIVCVDLEIPELGGLSYRTTFSWRVLRTAKKISLLLIGKEKQTIAQKLFESISSPETQILRTLLHYHPNVTLFMDEILYRFTEERSSTNKRIKTEL